MPDRNDEADNSGQDRVEAQLDDELIRFLTENTDLSPLQAERLVQKHGRDKKYLLEIAATMKAEG